MEPSAVEELTNISDRWSRPWIFWNHQVIGDGKTVYIRRLEILRTPLFSVMLHRIYRPDQQRELHDHPWSFLSLILRGWYEEDVPHRCQYHNCFFSGCPSSRKVRWFNWKRAEDSHSIRWVSRSPVWTLVFTGPKRRVWGFYGRDGWVRWDEYERLNDA